MFEENMCLENLGGGAGQWQACCSLVWWLCALNCVCWNPNRLWAIHMDNRASEHMCASFHSSVRKAELTRHKFGRRDRNFIYAINWVNLLVLMALSATSRTKRSCSCVKKMLGSSPAKSMNVLAQTDFCSQLPDAASCTKILTTNIIQMGRVQIRF